MGARNAMIDRLRDGPCWTRSFQASKAILNRLIAEGLVERCFSSSRRANMVRLVGPEGRFIDRLAQALSESGSIAAAACSIGIELDFANHLFRQIRADLGRQAR